MATESVPIGLGWHPDFAQRCKERLTSLALFQGSYDLGDDRPLPKAFSLSEYRLWSHDQGPVGTCWINAAVQQRQMRIAVAGDYDPVQLARAYVAHYAGAIEGRNAANGGSAGDAFLAMSDDSRQGKGACHEALWPYRPDSRLFAQTPSQEAIADGDHCRVTGIITPQFSEVKRLNFNGVGVCIGIWWPYGWDSAVDSSGRTTGVGSGTYGHELVITGWIDDWDGHTWYQIENSHGLIYHPLPADVASTVPGYKPFQPDKTSDFWVREDHLRTVLGKGGADFTAATGAEGFVKRVVPVTLDDVFKFTPRKRTL